MGDGLRHGTPVPLSLSARLEGLPYVYATPTARDLDGLRAGLELCARHGLPPPRDLTVRWFSSSEYDEAGALQTGYTLDGLPPIILLRSGLGASTLRELVVHEMAHVRDLHLVLNETESEQRAHETVRRVLRAESMLRDPIAAALIGR